eukprot:5744887-Pyramimonas_sp.AAC.1
MCLKRVRRRFEACLKLCEALRSALEAHAATLRSVPEALRSAIDVLQSAPGRAASSGNSLRE